MAIKLNAATGGGSVALDAPNSTDSNANVVLTLPTNDGESGQYLQTNGTGTLSWQTVASAAFESYAILEDQKSAGTAGGTFNTGSFLTRDLNTEVADPDGIVSLSSNQFTLGAGSYVIQWSAPAYDSGRHQSQLYNATDATSVGIGTSEYTLNNGAEQSRSFGSARVTITGSKAFEIRHRAENGNSTNGYGVESNFGVVEVYTRVEIFKEA